MIFEFPDDVHLILFESHLHKWFGCRVTAVSKVDSENVFPKGRKNCQQLQQLLFASQVLYLLWFSKEVSSSFLYTFAFNSL